MFRIGQWEFRFHYEIVNDYAKVVLIKKYDNGDYDYLSKDGVISCKKGEGIDPDKIQWFYPDMLQALMDGLWKQGLRPNNVRYENEEQLLRDQLKDRGDTIQWLKETSALLLAKVTER